MEEIRNQDVGSWPRECAKNDCLAVSENMCVEESGRSAYVRGSEHAGYVENHKERLALRKHRLEKHRSKDLAFQVSVTGEHENDTMMGEISESVRISKIPP